MADLWAQPQALLWRIDTLTTGNPQRVLSTDRLSYPYHLPSPSCSKHHNSDLRCHILSLNLRWQPSSSHQMLPVGSRCRFPDRKQLQLSSAQSYLDYARSFSGDYKRNRHPCHGMQRWRELLVDVLQIRLRLPDHGPILQLLSLCWRCILASFCHHFWSMRD